MSVRDELSLARLFPNCPMAVLADEFLRVCREDRQFAVETYLLERHVVFISTNAIRARGILICIPSAQQFWVDVREVDHLEEQVMTIAHEIAHTFEVDVMGWSIPQGLPPGFTHKSRMELFCKVFAWYWLEQEEVRAALRQLCIQLARDGRIDYRPLIQVG